MFTTSKDGKITAGCVLFPVSMLAFVVFIMLAFQCTQIFKEHSALQAAYAQQDKPLADAQKLQAQLDALAVGTLKLAQDGDKNAQAIVDRMKQLGITIQAPKAAGILSKAAAPAAAPAPAAMPETPAAE